MNRAEKRNIMAPMPNRNFRNHGSPGVTCNTAKVNPARVPGLDAFSIGSIKLSKSPLIYFTLFITYVNKLMSNREFILILNRIY